MKTRALLLCFLVAACKAPPSVEPDAGSTPDGGDVPDSGTVSRCALEPDCASAVSFSTRLDVDANRLNALRLTVCHGATCATARPVLTSTDSPGLPSADCVAAPGLSCALSRRGDGRFNATLTLTLGTGVTPADGDTVSLDVREGTAAPLLHVERQALFEPLDPGAECACRIARQFVLPSSASGLTCSTKRCESSARFSGTGAFRGSEPAARLCRGTACVSATLSWGDAADFAEATFDEPLAGARLTLSRTGFELAVPAAPDELADGDRYTLEVGGASVLDRTVTYRASTPNGAACDVQTCRVAP